METTSLKHHPWTRDFSPRTFPSLVPPRTSLTMPRVAQPRKTRGPGPADLHAAFWKLLVVSQQEKTRLQATELKELKAVFSFSEQTQVPAFAAEDKAWGEMQVTSKPFQLN